MRSKLVLLFSPLLFGAALAQAAPLLDFANGPGEKIKLSAFLDANIAVGVQNIAGQEDMYFRGGRFNWYVRGSHVDGGFEGPGGRRVAVLSDIEGGTFACANFLETSDRNVKENVEPVNHRKVLEQLLSLPIHTWSFTNGHSGVRNIGPMAQDFYATFKFGADDRHIASRNTAGVALAAIQGLHQLVQEQRTELDQKEARIQELEQQTAKMRSLDERVRTLERLLKESYSVDSGAPSKTFPNPAKAEVPPLYPDNVEAIELLSFDPL